jgi:hypothetical protein
MYALLKVFLLKRFYEFLRAYVKVLFEFVNLL